MLATRETLVSVYYALVQPYFDYCCLVWEPAGATLLKTSVTPK